jgi:exonuclease III
MYDNIKICTWNLCLRARCKVPLNKVLILENSIDVLCLQEIKINKQDDQNFYNIENFLVEFEGISDNYQICTLIYISTRIHYRRKTKLENDNSHTISLKLTKQGVMLASLYRTYKLTSYQRHHVAFEEQISVIKTFAT